MQSWRRLNTCLNTVDAIGVHEICDKCRQFFSEYRARPVMYTPYITHRSQLCFPLLSQLGKISFSTNATELMSGPCQHQRAYFCLIVNPGIGDQRNRDILLYFQEESYTGQCNGSLYHPSRLHLPQQAPWYVWF